MKLDRKKIFLSGLMLLIFSGYSPGHHFETLVNTPSEGQRLLLPEPGLGEWGVGAHKHSSFLFILIFL